MQRTARPKECADVLDAMDLGGIGKDAGLAIHDQGVVVPALPEFVAHVEKLISTIVALIVLLWFVQALDGLMTIGKRDNVPAHPSTAEVVECGKETGDVVGVVLADRKRSGEANPGGRRRHPGE